MRNNYFPVLTATTVTIVIDDKGSEIVCNLLPVAMTGEFNAISKRIDEALGDVEKLDAERLALLDIIKQSLPEAYHANLMRCTLPMAIELASVLMYGNPPDGQTKEEKKSVMRSEES